MTKRIDLIVGSARAAELINAYRGRLVIEDMLPDRAALAVACDAYADCCPYVIMAPGQFWRSTPGSSTEESLVIESISVDALQGHVATYTTNAGTRGRIPVDELDTYYELWYWPTTTSSSPIEGGR
jgi:hypothetical protein